MAEFYELVNSQLEELGELENPYDSLEEVRDNLEEVRDGHRKKAAKWAGGSLAFLSGGVVSQIYGVEALGELAPVGTAIGTVAALIGGGNSYRHKEKMRRADKYIMELESDNPEKNRAKDVASMLEPRQ